MQWWIFAAVAICCALLIQYLCSSKLLSMKQLLSIKTIALRDLRDEGQQLDEQANEYKNQQLTLATSIRRLLADITRLQTKLGEKNLPVPMADFPLDDPAADADSSKAG